jgi:hypothetical protein
MKSQLYAELYKTRHSCSEDRKTTVDNQIVNKNSNLSILMSVMYSFDSMRRKYQRGLIKDGKSGHGLSQGANLNLTTNSDFL